MKVSELIKKLKKMPKDTEVCIFDWRKNCFNDDGDGTGIGIEPVKEISLENSDEETESDFKPFVALGYNNCDYTDKAEIELGSSLASQIHSENK